MTEPAAEPSPAEPAPQPTPVAQSPAGPPQPAGEIGGPEGPEPTRYGDWEKAGRVSDF